MLKSGGAYLHFKYITSFFLHACMCLNTLILISCTIYFVTSTLLTNLLKKWQERYFIYCFFIFHKETILLLTYYSNHYNYSSATTTTTNTSITINFSCDVNYNNHQKRIFSPSKVGLILYLTDDVTCWFQKDKQIVVEKTPNKSLFIVLESTSGTEILVPTLPCVCLLMLLVYDITWCTRGYLLCPLLWHYCPHVSK